MYRSKIDFEPDVWNLYKDGHLCDYCDNKFSCKKKTCDCLETCQDIELNGVDGGEE